MPRVSVLMPAYDAEKYIADAIKSILNQTFTDFELIIVNDGSTDKTKQIIEEFDDKRIKYFENDGNKGLSFTRNRLIEISKGEFIAWLDSDDVANPQRLKEQVSFLDNNPKHAFVASWARLIDGDNHPTGNYLKSYIPNKYLRELLLFVNYIVQSSMLIRKSHLPKLLYDLNYPPTEDYELWVRILKEYQGEILPKVLVDYRIHNSNSSQVQSKKAEETVKLNQANQIKDIGINPTEAEISLHYQIGFGEIESINQLTEIEKWFLKIQSHNLTSKRFDKEALDFILAHRWARICTQNPEFGLKAVKIYFKSNFRKVTLQNIALIGVYLLKTIFQK